MTVLEFTAVVFLSILCGFVSGYRVRALVEPPRAEKKRVDLPDSRVVTLGGAHKGHEFVLYARTEGNSNGYTRMVYFVKEAPALVSASYQEIVETKR